MSQEKNKHLLLTIILKEVYWKEVKRGCFWHLSCWSVMAARLRGARHEAPQRRSKMAPATNIALSTGQEGSFLRELHLPEQAFSPEYV